MASRMEHQQRPVQEGLAEPARSKVHAHRNDGPHDQPGEQGRAGQECGHVDLVGHVAQAFAPAFGIASWGSEISSGAGPLALA